MGQLGHNMYIYYMGSVCNRHNACPDWLVLGHYFPVIPTAGKPEQKATKISSLLTSNVRSLRENLKPHPCRIRVSSREVLALGQ